MRKDHCSVSGRPLIRYGLGTLTVLILLAACGCASKQQMPEGMDGARLSRTSSAADLLKSLPDGKLAAVPEGSKPGQGPQVWRRDRQRPTVARVYVGDGN